MQPDGRLMASDYASGFVSNIFLGRKVPDVSGLVGLRPRAQYIMLPVEPGDQIDSALAGGNHPNGDETLPNDGWAAFSGTSAAAPQLAGICALIKQAYPKASPELVKHILMRTAKDVTTGKNIHGQLAHAGYDLATGTGLANTYQAVLLAHFYKLSSMIKDEVVEADKILEEVAANSKLIKDEVQHLTPILV